MLILSDGVFEVNDLKILMRIMAAPCPKYVVSTYFRLSKAAALRYDTAR